MSKGLEVLTTALVVAFIGWLLALFLGALMAFPVKWLWNYFMVDVLWFPAINFWHAWALMALSTLLFKSSVSTAKKD